MRTRIAAVLAGLGLLAAGCTSLSMPTAASPASAAPTGAGAAFDAAGWQAADPADSDDDTRCDEVDDLADVLLPGTARADVEALLGPGKRQDDGALVWLIGACGYSIDYSELWVSFDGDQLTEWREVQG